MKNYDPNKALEILNEKYIDILNSPEYIQGKRILHQRDRIKNFNIKKFLKRIIEFHKEKKVSNSLSRKEVGVYYNEGQYDENPPRGVIYTCITKGYDTVKDPLLVSRNVDYICFTDNMTQQSDVWNLKSINELPKEINGALINRYYKMHPFELFPDYDYSIYMDGNVQGISDLSMLYSIAAQSKLGIAIHLHSKRDCIYNEAKACTIYKRGNVEAIERLIDKYKKTGVPEHYGMLECTIIVVDLKNENAKKIFQEWWIELNDSNTGRDQLVLPYILWKNGYSINDIGILGNNEYRNPKFLITSHS